MKATTLWRLSLLLPYLAMGFPGLYNRLTPTLFGFPFFYWYQLGCILVASVHMGFAYSRLHDTPAGIA